MVWWGVLILQLHQLNFKHYGIPESLPWAAGATPLHSARLVPNHFLWDRVVVLLLVLSEIVCRISSSSQRPYTSVHCFPCYKKHLDTQTPYKSHIYGIHNKRSWQCTGHYKLNEETVTLTDKMQLSIFYEPPVMFFHEISVILKKKKTNQPNSKKLLNNFKTKLWILWPKSNRDRSQAHPAYPNWMRCSKYITWNIAPVLSLTDTCEPCSFPYFPQSMK